MKKTVVLLILILLSGFYNKSYSFQNKDNYYFKRLNITHGLSQNTVNAIIQDRKGFMWFGTKDGLNRFDGQSFQIFKYTPKKGNSLGNSFVTTLFEDSVGNIWVGTDAGIYIYYPKEEIFKPFTLKASDGSIVEKTVTIISGDKEGNIWIVAEMQGLYCYNSQTQSFTNYQLKKSNIRSFNIDKTGTIWVSFYEGGLFFSKDNLKTLHPLKGEDGKDLFKDEVISKTYLGPYNCLYVGSEKSGMKEVDLSTHKIRNLSLSDKSGELVFVRDFVPYLDNELWIGTESGIYIYNFKTDKSTHLRSSAYDTYSLSDNAVYSLFVDREEGLWIGTYFDGINYLPKQYTYFKKYYPTGRNTDLQGRRVREICESTNGTLWIGTEDNGLYNFNTKTNVFEFFAPSKDFTNVHGLCMDDDNLWVGTFSKGVRVINSQSQIVRSYFKGDNKNSLNDNSVFTICKTRTGDIYLGTLFGLLRYNKSTNEFTEIPELKDIFVYDIKEDSKGNLWLATYVNGAFRYDINRNKWTHYTHNEKDENSLPYNKVLSIFEDSKKRIWLTTQGRGFCQFDPEKEIFIQYNSHNGMPNDVVFQILEDDNGLFWITTNNGLVKFNPEDKSIRVFTVANGLLSNQFNYKSGFKTDDGTMLFGSTDGLISFNPNSFSENKYIPPVVITDFLLFNKKVEVGKPDSPLKKSITFSDSIELTSKQNSFSLRIAAMSYQAPEMNKLMYKLEGFDKEWLPVTESSLITYSNIGHGDYVFKVRGSNSDGIWNNKETQLYIKILPPFYLSIWAYILYLLIIIVSVFLFIRYIKRRNNEKQRRLLNLFNQKKERELYNTKIEFFTNVAHEIRTPLTLIKGPLDNIIKKGNMDEETSLDLDIMSKNTSRLLNLTNQLLDFRKTEIQGLNMNFVECNISEILRETSIRFIPLEKQKELDFKLNIPQDDFFAHVDKEAFTKILSNLFNNALKYSETYVHISLIIDKGENDVFHINIMNDGPVVPKEMREEIFKPFVRYNKNESEKAAVGTGIGLALSRSLAELHKGRLYMDEQLDINSFCLTLPVYQENTIQISGGSVVVDKYSIHKQTKVDKVKNNLPSILLVEDNHEMLLFVSRVLSNDYEVITAENGVKALEILDNVSVNLIISDIMMPQMDGFELCRAIKSDLNYSHVPIILLTAKTNLQSKIEAMDTGADAYIEKPFSNEYLLASVANLLQNREKVREAFTKSPFVAADTMAITKPDEEFLAKLNEIIQSNLSNPNFSIDDMADTFFMSRSSFYRKIKGIVGVSPNEFLRLERLKKAARLLKEDVAHVNEVCYMVGFNSPSYFSKCFYKQFEILPKDYTKTKGE